MQRCRGLPGLNRARSRFPVYKKSSASLFSARDIAERVEVAFASSICSSLCLDSHGEKSTNSYARSPGVTALSEFSLTRILVRGRVASHFALGL